MTKHEAVIVETYTGTVMLTGNDSKLAYEYAEKLLGHPVYTHEFPKFANELKEKSKPDFIELCRNLENDSPDGSDRIVIDGKEITDFPQGKKSQSIVMTKKGLFVNGYEYKNGVWKRTLRALWHLWF